MQDRVDAAGRAMRHDLDDTPWPLRPLIMAIVCAIGAVLFHWLVDQPAATWVNDKMIPAPEQWGFVDGKLTPFRQALAVFVAVSTLSFVVTVELRRWWWSVIFALAWGVILAFVGYFTASYNQNGEFFDFPFAAAVFAILLAAPLFQAARDMGRRVFPYARTHNHIWTDAVIGAASILFTAISFLLINLLAELFNLVGMDFLREWLNHEWFGWMIGGLAFGTAFGVLRERDALVSTMQRLVMIVLAVLAPVLAFGLGLFLLSLPFTGLTKLWDTTQATTPILLACAAGAFILANAVIGSGREERSPNRVLYGAATALAVCILPLAIIAAISMGLRIQQYGWTPSRIWGMLVVVVALGYGLSYLWAVIKGRQDWDDLARQWNLRGAIALVGIALFLALPILDFGSISAKDQLARLKNGTTPIHKFDWAAMAYDFGPKGREIVKSLTRDTNSAIATAAKEALETKNRWDIARDSYVEEMDDLPLNKRLVIVGDEVAPAQRDELVKALKQEYPQVCRFKACTVRKIGRDQWLVSGFEQMKSKERMFVLEQTGVRDDSGASWSYTPLMVADPAKVKPIKGGKAFDVAGEADSELLLADVETAKAEWKPVLRHQLYINGKPTNHYIDE